MYSVNSLDKYVFCTGFFGRAGITGIVRPPWTLGCPDYCHWATRAPWPCSCCWSWCHHKTILWIGSTNVSQFLHASGRPTTADPTNQGPTGGVNHAITGTCTTSGARGWSLRCSCQHKGELCWSLRERSRDGCHTLISSGDHLFVGIRPSLDHFEVLDTHR